MKIKEQVALLDRNGFVLKRLNANPLHYRVLNFRGRYIDWWPSTERWYLPVQPGGLPGRKGRGIDTLLKAMEAL